ncbi:tetratricopeptide repeat protein [Streptomyces gilvosporeus]|uniref:Uncharacterized protein n=1 Tax=Streptomyces gilvosporeus TaxID=553510 RepID=A0A1V0TZJ7_9ACTN|nr:tetratricopeptide repeat protein [Streptomyces gilvosporeus]ARF58317.1 hypothetical protein B1H19_32730 [Streptomyces gilvosporeus]
MDDRTDGGNAGKSVRNVLSGEAVVHGSVVQAQLIETLNSLTLSVPAPPEPEAPRQVPLPRGGFVNRTQEFASLRAAAESSGQGGPPGIIVITGLGGVGKTELVSQWVWREFADAFPDGQLYVDLAEVRRDGGVDVGAVIGTFLRDLDVDERYIPAGLADRSKRFRTVTAARPLLVVIDNARHAAEVRPLLPSRGLVVVLGRTRLTSLELDGAVSVVVDPLETAAGLQLVRRWRESTQDAGAAQRLVEVCGGLPLALRAACEWLMERPHQSLDAVVRELSEERPGPGVREAAAAVFDAVTDTFAPHTRALYDFLGRFPGTTFTAAVAEAAGVARFEDGLRDLRTAHMAVDAAEPERFRLHDVVAAHARARIESAPPQALRAVRRRVTDFYVTMAALADHLVLGPRLRLQEAPEEPARRLFTTKAEALEWLDAERANLLAVLRTAADEEWHDAVWRLCESLWALYHNRPHYADWIESHRLGIAAAQAVGRPDAQVRMHNQLARAHYSLGEYAAAEAELDRGEALLGTVTEARLHGVIWETHGLLRLAVDRPDEAIALFERALRANEGDTHGIVVQTYNLAQAVLAAGRPQEALDLLSGALATAEAEGDDSMRLRLGIVRGRALRALGREEAAMAAVNDAVRLAHQLQQWAKLEQALDLAQELGEGIHNAQVQRAVRGSVQELRRRGGIGETAA